MRSLSRDGRSVKAPETQYAFTHDMLTLSKNKIKSTRALNGTFHLVSYENKRLLDSVIRTKTRLISRKKLEQTG